MVCSIIVLSILMTIACWDDSVNGEIPSSENDVAPIHLSAGMSNDGDRDSSFTKWRPGNQHGRREKRFGLISSNAYGRG
ncbi:unnamed protein product [Schistosoma turkestanicum]|nr:unnamed protein product [Schistosoma turkestanicum]